MKNLMHSLMLSLCLVAIAPSTASAGTTASAYSADNRNGSQEPNEQALLARLKEIQKLAKTGNLSKAEKKELRKEVLAIRESYSRPGTYIYISGGALIIIIILLIILL